MPEKKRYSGCCISFLFPQGEPLTRLPGRGRLSGRTPLRPVYNRVGKAFPSLLVVPGRGRLSGRTPLRPVYIKNTGLTDHKLSIRPVHNAKIHNPRKRPRSWDFSAPIWLFKNNASDDFLIKILDLLNLQLHRAVLGHTTTGNKNIYCAPGVWHNL